MTLIFYQIKNHPANCEMIFKLSSSERLLSFTMAISAQKLANSGRIRLKRQRGYVRAALAALPVAFKLFCWCLVSVKIHIC